MAMSPQDRQLLETRQYQLNEIARIFRIPPQMLGDLSKTTFSNIEE
jgi:phage portal protein BeeE